jgi:tetratricopeptide (TPR) repeat protein
MKHLFLLIILVSILCTTAFAKCAPDADFGVDCLYSKWKTQPTRQHLRELLGPLFQVYISDAKNRAMRAFFDDLRAGNDPPVIRSLKKELIAHYTFGGASVHETAAMWTMQPADAINLYLLFLVDLSGLPDDISRAMQLAVYDQIRLSFSFESALRQQYAYFPPDEYGRLLEILHRLSWTHDPYLKRLNSYYQAVTLLNLGRIVEGRNLLAQTREGLEQCLMDADQKLSQKRILALLASVDQVLKKYPDAENDYLWILKIDPQDWNALINLSYLLNQTQKCMDRSIWVEAEIRSYQEFFDITIHCGSQELDPDDFDKAGPVVASLIR